MVDSSFLAVYIVLVFTKSATSAFSFLNREFGFTPKIISDREVEYNCGNCFITISHTEFDEISLRVGTRNSGSKRSYGAGLLSMLSSESEPRLITDRIASMPEQIEGALTQCAALLRIHGSRVLEGDQQVFDELQEIAEKNFNTERANLLRRRAEKAFAAKDFREAIRQYQLLEGQRKPLDTKRMQMAYRRLK